MISLDESGLGMWIMSKTVMMILLLGLVVALTGIMNIYQQSIIEDSARGTVLLWSEAANSVAAFTSGTAVWHVAPSLLIQGDSPESSTARDYTIAVTNRTGPSGQRLIFLLAWGSNPARETIDDFPGFATAVSVDLPPDVKQVYLFKGTLDSIKPPVPKRPELTSGTDGLVMHPSIGGEASDVAFLFMRDKEIFCVASKTRGEFNSTEAMNRLQECCNRTKIVDDPANPTSYNINNVPGDCF